MLSLLVVGLLAVEPAPAPPAADAPVVQKNDDLATLELQLEELNTRLRTLNTDWPFGSAVATYVGASVLPAALLAEGMLLLMSSVGGSRFNFIPPAAHIATLSVAGAALVSLVAGVATGVAISGPAREEKARLLEERKELEEHLRQMRRAAPVQVQAAPGELMFGWAFAF